MSVQNLLNGIDGIFWTIVYIEAIRIGIKDKSYAIPSLALGLNITWEFFYFLLGYQLLGFDMHVIINGIWFLFDIGLLYTYLRYGRRYFPANLHPCWFYPWTVLVLAGSFLFQYFFFIRFGVPVCAIYSAFLQNLLMSVLFIVMLVRRGSSEGQTMVIAVCKMIGSLAPTTLFGFVGFYLIAEPSRFVAVTGVFIALLDLVYIVMLALVKRKERNKAKRMLPASRSF